MAAQNALETTFTSLTVGDLFRDQRTFKGQVSPVSGPTVWPFTDNTDPHIQEVTAINWDDIDLYVFMLILARMFSIAAYACIISSSR